MLNEKIRNEWKVELGEVSLKSIELVSAETEKIASEDVRNFVYEALGYVDLKYWTAAASSTGKYHPPEDNGEGGLVRHVVKGCAVAEQYGRRAHFTQRELDMARAAFLLHDTCKGGVVWADYTDYTHGKIASEWLEQFKLEDHMAKQVILDAVRYHMAPWCYAVNPFEKRNYSKEEMLANLNEISRAMYPSRIEAAVQEADYWSSRESMSFFPGVSVQWERHDGPTEQE